MKSSQKKQIVVAYSFLTGCYYIVSCPCRLQVCSFYHTFDSIILQFGFDEYTYKVINLNDLSF